MNKTSTNSLIFYFDKAKQKKCVFRLHEKIYQNSRNNPLMLKGLKSVDLIIIQMYHFQLKWKRYMVCTNWWDSKFLEWDLHFLSFSSGTPTFCQMGVLNSCFKILVRALYFVEARNL